MRLFKAKKLRCFLTGIFTLLSCVLLNAQSVSSYIYVSEDAIITGEEYLFVSNAPEEENNFTSLAETESSPYIYISENTLIAGAEHVFVNQDLSGDLQKNTAEKQVDKVKKDYKASPSPENSIAGEKSKDILVALPFVPAPLSYLHCDEESATITSQYRLGEHQLIHKTDRENVYADNENANSTLYSPEQRQKFSAAATQCGILTSFGPNSPSCS